MRKTLVKHKYILTYWPGTFNILDRQRTAVIISSAYMVNMLLRSRLASTSP